METKYGRQTPTKSIVLPYEATEGIAAIERYNSSGRTAQDWQAQLSYDILATNEENLYVHTKFGYSVPRRNGKGEVLTIVENEGLHQGRNILHTAHRTATSSAASRRLADLLKLQGYEEVIRVKKAENHKKAFVYAKQFGLEKITLLDTGGTVSFRTRTSTGGLGEGFDTLIIDEAQEYTDDQQATLQYTVSDSYNPQIILCGTPPTTVSSGTVFEKLRGSCLRGETQETGWAEWSVDELTDVNDVDLWYECNPAMGYQLNERKVRAEDKTDEIDFNIQRLGLWLQYNQKSAISKIEWNNLKTDTLPPLQNDIFVGIKYGLTGLNVALAVAVKTEDGRIFTECLDCQGIRNGNDWIIDYIKHLKPRGIIIDGKQGQDILGEELKANGIKKYEFATVSQVITSNALFEQKLFNGGICHSGQPSVEQVVTNCERRAIGTGGGFGFKSQNSQIEIAILDAIILAIYEADRAKEKVKQKITF